VTRFWRLWSPKSATIVASVDRTLGWPPGPVPIPGSASLVVQYSVKVIIKAMTSERQDIIEENDGH